MRGILNRVAILSLLLAGCASSPRAPVIDRTPGTMGSATSSATGSKPAGVAPKPVEKPAAPAEARPETYTVRRGDTLYAIALDHGLEYQELAVWNAISDPNLIREGQVLRLNPPATVQVRPVAGAGSVTAQPLGGAGDTLKTEPKPLRLPYSEENLALIKRSANATQPSAVPLKPEVLKAEAPKPEVLKPEVLKPEAAKLEASKPAALPAKPEPQPIAEGDDEKLEWGWPAGGKLGAGFSDPANKGVDITGKKGDPVFASASGKVVYIGEGLRGYGKLVIVKHNNTYLSAYAHNDVILVKEQQAVVKGQKIAEIGSSGSDTTKLHFEIRRLGKPVDPMKFLPARP